MGTVALLTQKWSTNGSANGPVTWRENLKYIEIRVILLKNATNRNYKKLCLNRRFPARSTGILKTRRILYFLARRSFSESLNKITVLYNPMKVRSLVPIFKKAVICTSKNLVSNKVSVLFRAELQYSYLDVQTVWPACCFMLDGLRRILSDLTPVQFRTTSLGAGHCGDSSGFCAAMT